MVAGTEVDTWRAHTTWRVQGKPEQERNRLHAVFVQSLWQHILWCLRRLAQSTLGGTAAPWTHSTEGLYKSSWGQAWSLAGHAKGHLYLRLTKLHPRLFLRVKHWPEEMRCQRASVTAVAQAAGTLYAGERRLSRDTACSLHGSGKSRLSGVQQQSKLATSPGGRVASVLPFGGSVPVAEEEAGAPEEQRGLQLCLVSQSAGRTASRRWCRFCWQCALALDRMPYSPDHSLASQLHLWCYSGWKM